ncbi:MAG: cytochrome c oxidase subunit 3 family protein [Bacteroidales bacterium]|nr:cytochrome c oxidase subunit 3 family protein [Bacteroidales bacterium]MDT8431949.1 cytochrome c oxidase subunit 3 family protein [Bacteroidales bacterium]
MSVVHRDDIGSKLGMWLFIFTEILLFGGLFITYVVYRYLHQEAFHLASQELDVAIGTINTIILLISSATIAMSITAIQQKKKKLTLALIATTILLAIVFLVNKYFEWGAKFEHGIFPGSEYLDQLGFGDVLFFGLYFFMTGLHAFHIIIGIAVLGFMYYYVKTDRLTHDNFQLLENGGLYWHLVDLIWIFLFPLFYLIA